MNECVGNGECLYGEYNCAACEKVKLALSKVAKVNFTKYADGTNDRKDFKDKLDYEVLPWSVIEELAKVFQTANKKYGDNDSWKAEGPDSIPKYRSALQRHLNELRKGNPDVYTENYKGVDYTWRHSAQLVWNAMAICYKYLELEARDGTK